AIAVQLVELAADRVQVVERVRPLRMARELRDLPRREAREDAGGELAALRLQPADLLLNVDLGVRGDVLELLDLRFELGNRLFEIQEGNGHERGRVRARRAVRKRTAKRSISVRQRKTMRRRRPPARRTPRLRRRDRPALRAARATRGSRARSTRCRASARRRRPSPYILQ